MTTQHERDAETGLDYRGARFYDCEVGRFLSVDPLAMQRTASNSYCYVQANPIMRIDPDGKLDWIPEVLNSSYEENGVTIQSGFLAAKMEEGDNAETLANFLDISIERATELFNQQNEVGQVAIPNDIVPQINQAIHESKNPTGEDYIDDPWTPEFLETNYNCWESCVSIGLGEFIDYSNSMSSSDFKNNLIYRGINISSADLKFGRTIARWAKDDFNFPDGMEQHGATYIGTSLNGTNYYWSKNGKVEAPSVCSEQSLCKDYGEMQGLRGDASPFYNLIR